MSKNKKFLNASLNDEHIDLYEIIRHLLKKTKLIITTTLIFGLVGIIYFSVKPNEYYSSAIAAGLSDSTLPIFSYYDLIAPPSNEKIGSDKKLAELFDQLVKEILIKKNFQEFLNTNDSALGLKKFLEKNNISIVDYVNGDVLKKEAIKEELSTVPYLSKFTLKFPEGVEGEKILNQYISYSSRKILKNFFLNIEGIIKQKRFKKNHSLSIAKMLGVNSISEENLERAEYFKGKELLEAEIAGLNIELGYIQDTIKFLNNSNILSTEIIVSNPLFNLKWKSLYQEGRLQLRKNLTIKTIIFSLIFGFIFSIVIIFFQNIKKNF